MIKVRTIPMTNRSRKTLLSAVLALCCGLCLVSTLGMDTALAQCIDLDGDGFAGAGIECGYRDCDDTSPEIYPGAPEACDDIDNDCDTFVDEDGVCDVAEVPVLACTVSITPHTLNLKSHGTYITAFIQIPEGAAAEDIDEASIMLEDELGTEWTELEDEILIAKFDREAVIVLLEGYGLELPAYVELTVSGRLLDDQAHFAATDTIKVIKQGGGKKK